MSAPNLPLIGEVESPGAETGQNGTPAPQGEGKSTGREKFKNPSLRPRREPRRAAHAGADAIWGTPFVGSRQAPSGSSHPRPGHQGDVRTLPALPSGCKRLLLPGAIFAPPSAGVPGGGPGPGSRRLAVGEPRGGDGGRGTRLFRRRVPIPGSGEYAGTRPRGGAGPGDSVRGSPGAPGWVGGVGRGQRQTANCDSAGGGKRNTKAILSTGAEQWVIRLT